MSGWASFWGIFLVGALAIFAGIAVTVSIGGLGDVLAMLRRIRKSHETDTPPPGENAPSGSDEG